MNTDQIKEDSSRIVLIATHLCFQIASHDMSLAENDFFYTNLSLTSAPLSSVLTLTDKGVLEGQG